MGIFRSPETSVPPDAELGKLERFNLTTAIRELLDPKSTKTAEEIFSHPIPADLDMAELLRVSHLGRLSKEDIWKKNIANTLLAAAGLDVLHDVYAKPLDSRQVRIVTKGFGDMFERAINAAVWDTRKSIKLLRTTEFPAPIVTKVIGRLYEGKIHPDENHIRRIRELLANNLDIQVQGTIISQTPPYLRLLIRKFKKAYQHNPSYDDLVHMAQESMSILSLQASKNVPFHAASLSVFTHSLSPRSTEEYDITKFHIVGWRVTPTDEAMRAIPDAYSHIIGRYSNNYTGCPAAVRDLNHPIEEPGNEHLIAGILSRTLQYVESHPKLEKYIAGM